MGECSVSVLRAIKILKQLGKAAEGFESEYETEIAEVSGDCFAELEEWQSAMDHYGRAAVTKFTD